MQKDKQLALARAIEINDRFDRALASLSTSKCTNARAHLWPSTTSSQQPMFWPVFVWRSTFGSLTQRSAPNKKPLYVSAIGLVLALILTSIATDSQAKRRHVRVVDTQRCEPDDRYACASIFAPTNIYQVFEPLAPRIHHRQWKVTKRHHAKKIAKKIEKPAAVATVPAPPIRPEVITADDKESIFARYRRSREIIARPGVREVENLPPRLKMLLVNSAAHFKCSAIITSAYRDPAHNRRVGGAFRSQHLSKRATDFRMSCVDSNKLYAFVARQKGINGLGYYGPKGHVHADTRPAKQRVTWGGSPGQQFAAKHYRNKRWHRYARAA